MNKARLNPDNCDRGMEKRRHNEEANQTTTMTTLTVIYGQEQSF